MELIWQIAPWLGFLAFVLAMLALDLGVFHRSAHRVTLREAATWSAVWIGLAMAFNALIFAWHGPHAALEFFTGYLIEKSLSVDNLFVFVLVFAHFRVPVHLQHTALVWGVLGALAMRAVLIGAGIYMIAHFHWIIYVFGALLIVTGLRLVFRQEIEIHPEQSLPVRLLRRVMPVTRDYHDARFFIRQHGRLAATPLFVVLLVIESSDLAFAIDSIPAIFAVTDDPFIVYTSNIFAILGLRSLFFLVSGLMDRLEYFTFGLAAILIFIGLKMVFADIYPVPIPVALGVIVGCLATATLASLAVRRRRLRSTPLMQEPTDSKQAINGQEPDKKKRATKGRPR